MENRLGFLDGAGERQMDDATGPEAWTDRGSEATGWFLGCQSMDCVPVGVLWCPGIKETFQLCHKDIYTHPEVMPAPRFWPWSICADDSTSAQAFWELCPFCRGSWERAPSTALQRLLPPAARNSCSQPSEEGLDGKCHCSGICNCEWLLPREAAILLILHQNGFPAQRCRKPQKEET